MEEAVSYRVIDRGERGREGKWTSDTETQVGRGREEADGAYGAQTMNQKRGFVFAPSL